MKWGMEGEEIEAVLEKIWDLHDKLSDAIHSISRAHFLNSVKSPHRPERRKFYGDPGDESRTGYVFVKGFRVDDNDSAIQEAKSLNAIRTALENLEDQLEFFHTIHTQQRAERDAAIARLEQSRIVLATMLAEHHGKKYQVIEEALAFVGNVKDASRFVCPENLSGDKLTPRDEKRSHTLINILISSFSFAKNSLKFDHVRGILGNAALFAVSMIAMMHVHQEASKDNSHKKGENINYNRYRKNPQLGASSTDEFLDHLDVLMARG